MNQKTTYEILIAEKLEQVAVPDLQELIWARIEAALDAGNGDGNDGPSSGSPVGPKGIIGGIAGLVLIFLAAWFLITGRQQPETNAPLQMPVPAAPAVVSPGTGPPDKVIQNPDQPKFTAPGMTENIIDQPQDTLSASADMPFQPAADIPQPTVVLPATEAALPPPAVVDKDSSTIKKKRGVKGISPSDYKIVPKKDSSS